MCGIAGIVGVMPEGEARASIVNMLNAQIHRGPDAGGVHLTSTRSGVVGIGTRRLAIQDLSEAGAQPMLDEKSGNVLVFNGEIYNSPQLRSELVARGFGFRGHSDTEVVLKSFDCWGPEILPRLRGMYALALWQEAGNKILIARDPLGIKPIYYTFQNGIFVFASEIRALQAGAPGSYTLSDEAIRSYLAFGSVQEPHTIYKEVHTVEPGGILEVDPSGRVVHQARFWHMDRPTSDRPEEDLVETGRHLLRSSVERHLLSDVPVAVYLSSGLDSTAVLGYAGGVTDVSAFTVSFPDQPELDEAGLAASASARFGIKHIRSEVSGDDALAWARDGLRAMDQPAADGLNTYIVSRAARDHGLKVALSGQGGDEVFGGYRSFRGVPRAAALLRPASILPRAWRRSLGRAAGARKGMVAADKIGDMAHTGSDIAGLYLHSRRLFSDSWLTKLGVGVPEPSAALRDLVVPGDPIASVMRLEMNHYLRNTLLRDGDVFGMASSIEIRVPMLDQDLVEWALSLPGDQLLPKGAPPKHLLRQIGGGLFSQEQLTQAKKGFSLPLGHWMNGSLRPMVDEALAETSNVLDPAEVGSFRSLFEEQPNSASAFRLWSLVALGQWLKDNSTRS